MEADSLKKLAGKYKVPVGTIEKDYAVTILLDVISGFSGLSSMVFKGGTAIKKIYYPETRFSEDLDFTCTKDISKDLMAAIKEAIKNGLDVNFTGIEKVPTKEDSRKFSVNYNDHNDHPNSVKIDLSLREKVSDEAGKKPVSHIYDLDKKFTIPTMSLEEIMAEKVRAIIYSARPRHLYDFWYLMGKGISFDPDLARAKIKTVYKEEFDIEKLKERINKMKKRWKTDLDPLLPSIPSFEEISKIVVGKIEKRMK
jgi:predicted nucleotidyltransferase component of viral defense system